MTDVIRCASAAGVSRIACENPVRETPAAKKLDPDVLLRLEHIILSHQRLPEWGSPKPPMTPASPSQPRDSSSKIIANVVVSTSAPP